MLPLPQINSDIIIYWAKRCQVKKYLWEMDI